MFHSDSQSSLIRIEVDGAEYPVPEGITVIQAMWHLGRPTIHGVGCLGGVCGACPITYRLPDQMSSKTGLACQTAVREGMAITFIPSDSSKKAIALLPKEAPTQKTLFQYYPETRRCTACRACTSVCPQEIDVMGGAGGDQRRACKRGGEVHHLRDVRPLRGGLRSADQAPPCRDVCPPADRRLLSERGDRPASQDRGGSIGEICVGVGQASLCRRCSLVRLLPI
ncbi:MAG: 2Fe-2S iron-sulfur cluster-binding protein [Candidatus Manganitrophus sp.]|nr:2Fe-2S iron-sulfur cluster-binding protein [Candidatus Manganitrophus sp.]WDT72559.1 MAG: 2Fe-2S iron-sulfur cluster-binding protein [Candidatus Manganitrophus sp.]